MYDYIIGTITKINPKNIVLENNGIGYILIVSNPYNFKLNETLKVFTYQHVREDINDLYGFKTEEEKELFIKLIGVNGIGPKSALSVLACGRVKDVVDAIESRNDAYLRKFPGIGPKASQQIILDLKGKISFIEEIPVSNKSQKLIDCEDALISLGYSKKDVSKVLGNVDINKEEGEIIKEALQLLMR